jgi:hypothetical protein
MIWWVVAAPVLFFAVFVAALYLLQDRLVYHPGGTIEATPADVGLPFEDVTFTASDGVTLTGWYVPAETPDAPTVLFCHGNGGNISHRLATLQILHRLGLGVLIFDYRGYGRSEGTPSEQGTYADVRAAWDYLVDQRDIPPDRIVLQGRSLGASVAAWLGREVRPAGVIVESAMISAPELGSEMYRFIPGFLMRALCRYEYDTHSDLAAAQCPVMVMHSPGDTMVPFAHGQAVYAAANEPKRFVELRGGHNDAHEVSGGIYTEAIRAFVARCVSGE